MAPSQSDTVSRLVIDLGKILFAAFVVGFFIPGFSGSVSLFAFANGALSSAILFFVGVKLAK